MLFLNKRVPIVLLFLLALLLCWTPFTAHSLSVEVREDFKSKTLGYDLEYIADKKNRSFESISKVPDWTLSRMKQLNFGFTEDVFWIRFQVNNSAERPLKLILQVENIYLDYLDFFVSDQDNNVSHTQAVGDHLPADKRDIKHVHFLHAIHIKPDETLTVALRVSSSSSISLPMQLWERDAFIEDDYKRTIFLGAFFGILVMFSFYHLLISVLTKDWSLFYYSVFIFSVLVLFMMREGVLSLMLWPGSFFASEPTNIFALTTASVSIFLFTSRILRLKESHPLMNKVFIGAASVTLLPSICVFFVSYNILIRVTLFLDLVLVLVYVTVLMQRIRDKYQPARHLVRASVFAILGLTLGILTVLGYAPINAYTHTLVYGCVAAMALFFALSISYRINLDRLLREEAQQKLTHKLDELVREQTEELEQVNDKLRIVSITDGLTQLYNRRHFDDVFHVEFNRSFREGFPLAVLIFDIDHFKKLNDTHGHGFGDHCLRVAGKLIKDVAQRPSDTAARYGGEEFVVLLPDTGMEGANIIANRIRQSFENTLVEEDGISTTMTVSIGVASEIPKEKDQHEALLNRADAWLYKAKQNGRNRVEGDAIE